MRFIATALLGLIGPIALAAQASDTVVVRLGDGVTEVRQRLTPVDDAVEVFALRIEGQTLDVAEVVREGERLLDARLTATERAYRLDVSSGAPIVIRYTVTGSLDRVPLFVSGGRAELTVVRDDVEAPYLVRLEGPEGRLSALDLPTTLPRFGAADDGAVEVALSSLPALVRLSRGGALSFTRVADLVVLALILAGAVWTWRNARVRRPTRGSAS